VTSSFDPEHSGAVTFSALMNPTETMLQEINGLLRAAGDEELRIETATAGRSELELLRIVRQEYTRRLLQKVPQYRGLAQNQLIPDMFLQALIHREAELKRGLPCNSGIASAASGRGGQDGMV